MLKKYFLWRDYPIALKFAILIVAVAVIPLAGITAYNEMVARADFISTTHTQNLQRARATAHALDTLLEEHLSDARLAATLPDTIAYLSKSSHLDSPDEAQENLIQLANTHSYDAIYLTDSAGTVVLASDQRFLGRNYLTARWVQNALSGQQIFDEPRYDPIEQLVYLHFSAPVRDHRGAIIGAAISRVTMEEIDQIIVADTNYSGSDEYGVLFDDQGIRLSHESRPDLRFVPIAPLLPEASIPIIAEERFGPATENLLKSASRETQVMDRIHALFYSDQADPFITYNSLAAGPVYASLTPLKNKRWVYGIVTPDSNLSTMLIAQMIRTIQIALLAGVLAILVAFVGARWLTRHIRAVAEAANALAAGDLSRRVHLAQNDEVGQLAHAFDTMADVLVDKDKQLRDYAGKLEQRVQERTRQIAAASKRGRDLAETLDPPILYARIAQAAQELLPDISTVFISLYNPDHKTLTALYGIQDGTPIDTSNLPPLPLEPPGIGTQSQVVRTRLPLIVDNLPEKLNHVQTAVTVGTPGPTSQSALCLPMISKDKVVGVLQAQSYTPARFTLEDAELLGLVANTAAVSIENARLFIETQHRLESVQALRAIDLALTNSFDLRLTLSVLLQQLTTLLSVDAADILIINSNTQLLEYCASRGIRSRDVEYKTIRFGEYLAGRIAIERKTIQVRDWKNERANFGSLQLPTPFFQSAGMVSYFGLPLIAKGEVRGVLEVCHRSILSPDAEWFEFLETLAGQAAVAIESTQLFDRLQRTNIELALAYNDTIEGWSRALDLRDKETEGHSRRVADLTERLARAMQIDEHLLVDIRRGALLHDIGKMGIPDHILLKPDSLTDEEWVIMRRHPALAYDLLSPIEYLRAAIDIPFCHHEKWNGTGYPRGLVGEEIPLAARIFAIIDVWDAVTSDRPYRPAWSKARAREYIAQQSGTQFDPKIVQAFLQMIQNDQTNP